MNNARLVFGKKLESKFFNIRTYTKLRKRFLLPLTILFILPFMLFGKTVTEAQAAIGEWGLIGPWTGENIRAIAIDPSNSAVIYAGTELGGIYKSTDSGANWTASNNGLTFDIYGYGIGSIAMNPSNTAVIYAAAGSSIYKSTDSGANWAVANNWMTGYVPALAIVSSSLIHFTQEHQDRVYSKVLTPAQTGLLSIQG